MMDHLNFAKKLALSEPSAMSFALISIAESLHKLANPAQSTVVEVGDRVAELTDEHLEFIWCDQGGDRWRYDDGKWLIRDSGDGFRDTTLVPTKRWGPYTCVGAA